MPQTERQRDLFHEHQGKARRMIGYQDRMNTQKRQQLDWLEAGRGWENETEKSWPLQQGNSVFVRGKNS
jgi:hypothetical protein